MLPSQRCLSGALMFPMFMRSCRIRTLWRQPTVEKYVFERIKEPRDPTVQVGRSFAGPTITTRSITGSVPTTAGVGGSPNAVSEVRRSSTRLSLTNPVSHHFGYWMIRWDPREIGLRVRFSGGFLVPKRQPYHTRDRLIMHFPLS